MLIKDKKALKKPIAPNKDGKMPFQKVDKNSTFLYALHKSLFYSNFHLLSFWRSTNHLFLSSQIDK